VLCGLGDETEVLSGVERGEEEREDVHNSGRMERLYGEDRCVLSTKETRAYSFSVSFSFSF